MGERNAIRQMGNKPMGDFTVILNEFARDVELSHTARSVMLLLCSHADGYEVSAKSIAASMGVKNPAAIRKALDELDARRWLAIKRLPGNRREYWMHRSRRFTEAEHAELTGTDLARKSSKGLHEKRAGTLHENRPTKKTNKKTNLENNTSYVSNAGGREADPVAAFGATLRCPLLTERARIEQINDNRSRQIAALEGMMQ